MRQRDPRIGEKISGNLSATFISELRRMLKWYYNQGGNSSIEAGLIGEPSILYGFNDTATDIDAYNVVEITGPVTTDEAEFDDQFINVHAVKIKKADDRFDPSKAYAVTQRKIFGNTSAVERVGLMKSKGFTIMDVKPNPTSPLLDNWVSLNSDGDSQVEAFGPWKIVSKDDGDPTAKALVDLDPVRQIIQIGEAKTTISAGDSGMIDLFRRADEMASAPTDDNGLDIEAYHDWMTGSQQISAGKQVTVAWFDREGLWRIIGAECEDSP